jgi:hypothetical protein
MAGMKNYDDMKATGRNRLAHIAALAAEALTRFSGNAV